MEINQYLYGKQDVVTSEQDRVVSQDRLQIADQGRAEAVQNRDFQTLSNRESVERKVVPDLFWSEDFSILFRKDRAMEFFPRPDMAFSEKLNAITRFSIYLGLCVWLYNGQTGMFYVPLIVMVILYLIYRNRTLGDSDETLKFADFEEGLDHYEQTRAVDENGNECQVPSQDNPFMNVLLTDYVDQPNRPPACNVENPETKEEINRNFEHNLYRDVNDVWQRNNNQMRYHTQPSTTIPNDRDTFMKWCWDTPFACKDGDMQVCNRYVGLGDGHPHGKITGISQ